LLQKVYAVPMPARIPALIAERIRRAAQIGWLTAANPAHPETLPGEAAIGYQEDQFFEFVQAFGACGLSDGPQSDFLSAREAAQSRFGLKEDSDYQIASAVALGWSQIRPKDAISFLVNQSWLKPDQKGDLIALCISSVSAFNQALAKRLLFEFAPNIGPERLASLCIVVRPESVEALLDGLPAGNRKGFLKSLTDGSYHGDQCARWEMCSSLDPGKLSQDEKCLVGTALFASVPEEAMSWFLRIPENERAGVVDTAYEKGDWKDNGFGSAGASELYLQLIGESTNNKSNLIYQAIDEVAENNLDEALGAVHQLPESLRSEAEKTAYAAAAAQLGSTSPGEVPKFLDQTPQEAKDRAIEYAVNSWSIEDPEGALAWAQSQPNRKLGSQVGNSILTTCALTLPELESDCFAGLAKADKPLTYKSAFQRLIDEYSKTDPGKAVDCLSRISDPELQRNLTDHLAKSWCAIDPVAASDWIASLPSGPGRDSAIAELLEAARDDPEAALASAPAIADREMRIKAVTAVLSTWTKLNATYAQELLSRLNLPADEQAAISDGLNAGPVETGSANRP
jgi:hypothetical protein